MITEIAQIEIDPDRATEFEAAVSAAHAHFQAAKGFVSLSLGRSIEQPGRYRLMVGWETIDNHMVDFRNSEGFQAWRALAGPFFLSPPQVEHIRQVLPA